MPSPDGENFRDLSHYGRHPHQAGDQDMEGIIMAKKDINSITLIGILAGDAKLTESGNRSSLLFTLASKDGYTKKDGTESTSFIRCSLSSPAGGYASKMAQYMTKGQRIGLSGSLRTWATKGDDGKYLDGYMVQADSVQLLSGRSGNDDHTETQQNQPADETIKLDITSDDLPF
jgi:single-strand DNA-binding protein